MWTSLQRGHWTALICRLSCTDWCLRVQQCVRRRTGWGCQPTQLEFFECLPLSARVHRRSVCRWSAVCRESAVCRRLPGVCGRSAVCRCLPRVCCLSLSAGSLRSVCCLPGVCGRSAVCRASVNPVSAVCEDRVVMRLPMSRRKTDRWPEAPRLSDGPALTDWPVPAGSRRASGGRRTAQQTGREVHSEPSMAAGPRSRSPRWLGRHRRQAVVVRSHTSVGATARRLNVSPI